MWWLSSDKVQVFIDLKVYEDYKAVFNSLKGCDTGIICILVLFLDWQQRRKSYKSKALFLEIPPASGSFHR